MNTSSISTIYRMVCEVPNEQGFHIEYMPEFFDNDTMDNSLPHVHTFYEIIWFKEAGGIHSVDFKDYEIKKDSLFFLSPGQVHHFDNSTRNKGIIIKFCADFLKNDLADEDLFIKYNIFNAFDSEPYCTVDSEVLDILNLVVKKMEDEVSLNGRFGHLDMLRSLIRILLIYVERHGRRNDAISLNETKTSHRQFVLFRKLIEREYRCLHTVKQYADLLNISGKTLTNSVIECSGKTPLAFINNRIVLEAKRLLRFTDMMVKEIANYLGFEDPSYFVKFFKREVRMSPTEFRETGSEYSIIRKYVMK